MVRYAAPSAPAAIELLSMRRKRMTQVYTREMSPGIDAIADLDARVTANRRLSADHNVLSLAAPDIAARARPGQFVMIKASRGLDPLLRRPFSIFEVLREDD